MLNRSINEAMKAYNILHNRESDLDGVAREKVAGYISALLEFGETDDRRLISMGLRYLTDLDETNARPNGFPRSHFH